ncbi:hypothetical protein D9758_005460 [Tetrapyrgos nigripes]|uniref:Uncharacterized protein n=1 Tax=Tetrapyrgos nigripes TaxID=182062 RepID=A0A8H5LPJ1_9AGAR|nr:hypothetical protein D9758_005460 [Tetrapyrgos nigripes]
MSSTIQKSGPLLDTDLFSLREWVAERAISSLLYGIYATLSLTTVYLLLAKGLNSKGRVGLMWLTTFMFLTSTLSVILGLEFILLQLPLDSFNPPDPDAIIQLTTNIEIALGFIFVISDAIVVWRAWIMFPRNLLVKFVLTMCMLGSCAGAFTDEGFIIAEFLKDPDSNGAGGKDGVSVMTAPLLFTNLVATLFIGYKTWSHYQAVKVNLGSSKGSSTKVLKIMFLLVESGLFYCALWISYIVISQLGDGHTLSYDVYSFCHPDPIRHLPDSDHPDCIP